MNTMLKPFILALFCVFLVGCGGRAQVSGKITFEDGSPLTVGDVAAESTDGVRVIGTLAEDGTYTLFEGKPGDGIPSGRQYKIFIANAVQIIPSKQMIKDEREGGGMMPGPDTVIPLIQADYSIPSTTPVTLDIPRGSPKITHDITVKKP